MTRGLIGFRLSRNHSIQPRMDTNGKQVESGLETNSPISERQRVLVSRPPLLSNSCLFVVLNAWLRLRLDYQRWRSASARYTADLTTWERTRRRSSGGQAVF